MDQQEVWKKSHGVWLEACRHRLEDNLPPSDLLHNTIDITFETRGGVSRYVPSEILSTGPWMLGSSVSIHVPKFVIEPEHSFLNFSRIQSCSWSFCLGIVHETVNVIDLVISETTLDEHVIRMPCLDQFQHQLSQHLSMPCSLLQRNLTGSVWDVVQQPHTGDSQ